MTTPPTTSPDGRPLARFFQCLILLTALACPTPLTPPANAADQLAPSPTPNLRLWDSQSRLGNLLDTSERNSWKPVPSDLLDLEANPAKAKSDPGYYGREYQFTGDAVVETGNLIAVFSQTILPVRLYAKPTPGVPAPIPSRPFLYSVPIPMAGPVTNTTIHLLRHAADEIVLGLGLGKGKSSSDSMVSFSFGRSEVIEVRTQDSLRGLRFLAPIEYGILPGFVTDDLIFPTPGWQESKEGSAVHLPAENVFVGLLMGGNQAVVATWPQGRQQARLTTLPRLRANQEATPQPHFDGFDLDTDGKGLCLATITAPGLWHRQTLVATNLEADVRLDWQPPFPARWKTQLLEADVRTTFNFHASRGEIWRGVPGSYIYPAFITNGVAYLHPSKKIPPKGEALIYFLEGNDTPPGVTTPFELIQSTLGRSFAAELMDTPGRRLRTHHRRGGEGVHRACTCGCTEAIQAVFEAGQEVERKDYIQGALDDMIYFVARHVERIGEYQQFAEQLARRLDALATADPELKEYLDGLKEIVALIPQECTLQKDNMKSPQHADDLAKRTLALTRQKASGNVAAYMELLKEWREMGGSQDYVVAQCHVVTRRVFQEAGYRAASNPKALQAAREIRTLCRQTLRNPDGYEVWSEY